MCKTGLLVGAFLLMSQASAGAQPVDDGAVEYSYCVASSPDAVYVSDVQAVTPQKPVPYLTSAWAAYILTVNPDAKGGYCRGGVMGKLTAYAARDGEARKLLEPLAQQRPVYTSWIG